MAYTTRVKQRCPHCGKMKVGLDDHIKCKHPQVPATTPLQPIISLQHLAEQHHDPNPASPSISLESEDFDVLALFEQLVRQYDEIEVDATFAPNLRKLNSGLHSKKIPPEKIEGIHEFIDEMKHFGFYDYDVAPVLPSIQPPPLINAVPATRTIHTNSISPSTVSVGAATFPAVDEARGMTFAVLSIRLNAILDALHRKQQFPNLEERIKELLSILESKIPSWATTTLSLQIVNRLRKEFPTLLQPPQEIDADHPTVLVQKLPWRFLPPGETGRMRLFKAIQEFHERNPHCAIDKSRLVFAYSLKPKCVYVGEDEFDGYFAFVFSNTRRVLLENPIEGNAAYVFIEDWKFLSKLPKTDLLSLHDHGVKRAIHLGLWRTRIRSLLKIGKR
jgi:hypothetical protein